MFQNLFSIIRASNGSNMHPSANVFRSALRLTATCQLLRSLLRGNCSPGSDDDTLLSIMNSMRKLRTVVLDDCAHVTRYYLLLNQVKNLFEGFRIKLLPSGSLSFWMYDFLSLPWRDALVESISMAWSYCYGCWFSGLLNFLSLNMISPLTCTNVAFIAKCFFHDPLTHCMSSKINYFRIQFLCIDSYWYLNWSSILQRLCRPCIYISVTWITGLLCRTIGAISKSKWRCWAPRTGR